MAGGYKAGFRGLLLNLTTLDAVEWVGGVVVFVVGRVSRGECPSLVSVRCEIGQA